MSNFWDGSFMSQLKKTNENLSNIDKTLNGILQELKKINDRTEENNKK
ncbi:MAG: hypothetical protein ACRDA7_02420 [Metamycoplasmataceae bacterium]